MMHPLHPRPTFCTSSMACVDPLFFYPLPKGRTHGVVKISRRFFGGLSKIDMNNITGSKEISNGEEEMDDLIKFCWKYRSIS